MVGQFTVQLAKAHQRLEPAHSSTAAQGTCGKQTSRQPQSAAVAADAAAAAGAAGAAQFAVSKVMPAFSPLPASLGSLFPAVHKDEHLVLACRLHDLPGSRHSAGRQRTHSVNGEGRRTHGLRSLACSQGLDTCA